MAFFAPAENAQGIQRSHSDLVNEGIRQVVKTV